MTNLIIDAVNEKIIFVIITDTQLYTTSYLNSRENFDNFMKLLLTFIQKKIKSINDINRIFVNLGPGKFTSLRISLSIAKAISFVNKASLIGFKSEDLKNKNYKNILKLHQKKFIIKGLIKPIYSS
tara:strand:+ start:466 stop:843 length:378 start_codon:yes stop_codon:yes gene_type:complete